mmetsp:Transcript_19004/g.60774  ORF Transcript_19004/g.60774 Transcript_19004/m.60774 type:complete len:91 (-) Transcript_19004:1005-1277(-)
MAYRLKQCLLHDQSGEQRSPETAFAPESSELCIRCQRGAQLVSAQVSNRSALQMAEPRQFVDHVTKLNKILGDVRDARQATREANQPLSV